MRNYIAPGEVRTFDVPEGGVVSGQAYLEGVAVAIATATVAYASGATFEGITRGVVRTAQKVGSQAWARGALVYWDDTAKKFTTAADEDNVLVGFANEAIGSGSGETTAEVYLDGCARESEPPAEPPEG